MSAQRWQRISVLFDRIVELDEPAREEALAALDGDDADLRADVERLLRGDAEIERGAPDPVADPFTAIEPDTFRADVAGTLIGPWRVLREIGRGGMGVVHLVERADGQFEQRAALKLMRASGDPAGLRRRFLRERQILAKLEHPHIARLLDGGVSAAGEPYFALEYIDGEPLLEHVAAHGADLGLRLRLFLDVCAAVQFAHRQLVVHCDIKPTNILVSRDGAAKLLDFGIANLLAADAASTAETQMRALTPAYAAPEQLRGEAVTTAADVYSLGAVLYELLTGVRAYRIGASASPVERLAAISDARRALPSAATTGNPTPAPDAPAAFAAVPPRLLRGDLDIITSTALQADPEQRYASVEALADDVRRFMAGAPIQARAPSTRYRLGKFVARHRTGVALAAIAVVALLAALGTALVQAQRAREQAVQAHEAANRALRQSERAEAVRRILVGVFEQAAPEANDGKPITARELLEKGERQIEQSIAAQPAIEADAATLIAELYVQISEFERAEVLLQRALQATDDPRVPDDVKARVLVGIAAIQDEKTAYDEAIGHARRGLALLADAGPGAAPTVAKAHYVIAHALVSLGRTAEAETILLESLARDRAALGVDSDAVADSLVQLGNVYASDFRFAESEKAFREAIAAFTSRYGEDSYHVAHVLNELSNMLSDKGDMDGAEKALRQSHSIRMRTVGPDHRDTLIVQHNLLTLLETTGRIREALPERRELVRRVASGGRVHRRDFATIELALGRDLRDAGEFDEAIPILREAAAAAAESLGKDSNLAIVALRSLADALALAGQHDEAERLLREALALQEGRAPVDATRVALASADLADLLRERGQFDEALRLAQAAAKVFEQEGLGGISVRRNALATLAEVQLDLGDPAAALANAEMATQITRKNLGAAHFQLARPLLAEARARHALGNGAAALPLLEQALQVGGSVQMPGDPRMLEIEVERVLVLGALGRDVEAAAQRARIAPLLRALPAAQSGPLEARLASGSAR